MSTPLPQPGGAMEHYVSTAPFDPMSVETMTAEQSRVYQASQLRLMWWKFKRHKVALASGIFLAALYLLILVAEFIAPYNLHTRNMDYIYSPPQRVRLFDSGGNFVGPFVYGREMQLEDRKSTRLNSSHVKISYAVFCLKKKTRIRCKGGEN